MRAFIKGGKAREILKAFKSMYTHTQPPAHSHKRCTESNIAIKDHACITAVLKMQNRTFINRNVAAAFLLAMQHPVKRPLLGTA